MPAPEICDSDSGRPDVAQHRVVHHLGIRCSRRSPAPGTSSSPHRPGLPLADGRRRLASVAARQSRTTATRPLTISMRDKHGHQRLARPPLSIIAPSSGRGQRADDAGPGCRLRRPPPALQHRDCRRCIELEVRREDVRHDQHEVRIARELEQRPRKACGRHRAAHALVRSSRISA